MAEWLRRLTRNQMGSSRVGSNPTRSGRGVFYLFPSGFPFSLIGHVSQHFQRPFKRHIPHGLVARISGFHPGGPGSIPGAGVFNCRAVHQFGSGLQLITFYADDASFTLQSAWGYSSVVEHSTADREVPGSNPGVPFKL